MPEFTATDLPQTEPAPNQIQLQVQVNQQYNTEEYEPTIPAMDMTTLEDDREPENEPPPRENKSPLALVALIVIFIVFLWPFVLMALNYYTDFNLWRFMRSTRQTYGDAQSNIHDARTDIRTLTCAYNGENTLSSFQSFMLNRSADTGCDCVDIINVASSCDALNDASWTTTNFDASLCVGASYECVQCTNCSADSVYAYNAPHFLYSQHVYDAYNDEEKEQFCSPDKMRLTLNRDALEAQFASCGYACIVFFAISGIWITCQLCAGCKVRYRDLYRAYLWFYKGMEPKKTEKLHPQNSVNRDEFTLFVVAILFLHVFEDVIQCIIAMVFNLYKQANGGGDCIVAWSNLSYVNGVELVPYNGGTDIIAIMTRDDAVELFFLASFLSVFFTGLYTIRLFTFDIVKVTLYPWWKNILFFMVGVLLGLFFILLVLSPFWGAVWMRADSLYLTQSESAFLMWTFIVGMIGYVVAICMPLCFIDQLDCDCECGDGCC